MKNLTLLMIAVWSFIGLVIIAALVFFTIFSDNEGSFFKGIFGSSDTSDMQIVSEKTIPMDGIKKVELELFSDNCNFYFTDTESIEVKHYARNVPQGRYARAEVMGSTVNISTKPQGLNGFSMFGLMSRSTVDVILPESYKEALSTNLTSGSLRFYNDVKLSDLTVKVSSGMVGSEYAVEAQALDVTVTSGSVRLTGGVTADNYALKTSSGNINISKGVKGSGSVNVTSGRISLEGVDITESLSAKASSGTVSIVIADNPSLEFNGKVSSGTVRTYFNTQKDGSSYSATVGEGPYKNLDVQVTSGTVRITQK